MACLATRRSVTGCVVYVEGAIVAVKSGMQRIVALSIAEAKLIALIQCIQEMMYVKKLIESLELTVELPMLVECDNKGGVDLANGWSVSKNSNHINVCINFFRELKENKIIRIE